METLTAAEISIQMIWTWEDIRDEVYDTLNEDWVVRISLELLDF